MHDPLRTALALIAAVTSAGCVPRAEPSQAQSRERNSWFIESAAARGISFRHDNGASGRFRFIESTPAGVALFDFDNDGWLDLFFVQSGSSEAAPEGERPRCALYRNEGEGRFMEITRGSGLDADLGYAQGVAAGDYDNDGFEDLFITSYGRSFLFHNERGSGRFRDVTHEMGLRRRHSTGYATSAAFGDFNNDGRLDLYVCYYCPWTWNIDRACHGGSGERDYCSPEVYDPDVHRLYRNDGSRFTDVSEEAGITKTKGRGLAVAFVDYDADGRQDIFVANDLSANMLWRNNGDGTFTDRAQAAGCAFAEGGQNMAAMGVAIADYDRSSFPSLFVTNFARQPNTLFKNIGGGAFQDVAVPSGLAIPHMPYLAFGCEFLDVDLDGRPDLLVANGHVQVTAASRSDGTTYKERKQLFRNRGDGTFEEVTGERLGDLRREVVSRGLAVGDIDNDGLVDAVASNQNDPAELFINRTPRAGNWVSFRTIGRKSNRDGRHTRIRVTCGGATQTDWVRAGSSYLSVSDRRVHFGLGSASRVEKAELTWPSGVRETLTDLAAGQIYVVTEGRGITGRQPLRGTQESVSN